MEEILGTIFIILLSAVMAIFVFWQDLKPYIHHTFRFLRKSQRRKKIEGLKVAIALQLPNGSKTDYEAKLIDTLYRHGVRCIPPARNEILSLLEHMPENDLKEKLGFPDLIVVGTVIKPDKNRGDKSKKVKVDLRLFSNLDDYGAAIVSGNNPNLIIEEVAEKIINQAAEFRATKLLNPVIGKKLLQ